MFVQPIHFVPNGVFDLLHLLFEQLRHVLFLCRDPCGRADGLLCPRAGCGHDVNNAPSVGGKLGLVGAIDVDFEL